MAVRGVFRCTEGAGSDVILSTASTTAATALGLTAYVDSDTESLKVRVGTGLASIVSASSDESSCLKDTVHWLAFRWESGVTGDEFKLWLDGALVDSGNSGTPSAAAPDNPLAVGSLGPGGDYFGGKIAEVDIYAMTAAEADFMIQRKARLYTTARYGL